MNQKSHEVSAAIADVQFILDTFENEAPRTPRALRTEAILLGTLLAADVALLVGEFVSGGNISASVLETAGSWQVQAIGMLQIFAALSVVAGGVYFLAWRRAREAQSTLNRFLKRDLTSLSLNQVLPDLLLKFFVVATVLFANKPDLLSAVLVAFTADYTLQGRFFRLPPAIRIGAGVALYSAAAYMVFAQVTSVAPALGCFAAISAVSLAYICYVLNKRVAA